MLFLTTIATDSGILEQEPRSLRLHTNNVAPSFFTWSKPARQRVCRGALALLVSSSVVSVGVSPADAAPLTFSAKKGLGLAKKGDCVGAMPLLEKAEQKNHTPTTASALAGCHLSLGDLLAARDLYRGLSNEAPTRAWSRDDRRAHDEAKDKADALDARIPKVTFSGEQVSGLEVHVGDVLVSNLAEGTSLPPDEKVKIYITAPGYETIDDTITMTEGKRRDYAIHLVKAGANRNRQKRDDAHGRHPTTWIGGHFRGQVIPKFWMHLVADGGKTMVAPGIELNLTKRFGNWDVEPSFGFTSYRMGATPFRPHARPNSEWEIDESTLAGFELKLDIFYRAPLDKAETVSIRVGGGVGLGGMAFGSLRRTQAYPKGNPDDPSTYTKCVGPNNPAGTFLYCNQLDKDASRYNQNDKVWGLGGLRPSIYPWLTLPEVGLEWDVARKVALDLDMGLALTGFTIGAGARFGL